MRIIPKNKGVQQGAARLASQVGCEMNGSKLPRLLSPVDPQQVEKQ